MVDLFPIDTRITRGVVICVLRMTQSCDKVLVIMNYIEKKKKCEKKVGMFLPLVFD